MSGKPFPIVLTGLDRARCLVVGGGSVAERKVRALLECAARVTVVSPTLSEQLRQWAPEHVDVRARAFKPDDLGEGDERVVLVIAATSNSAVNAGVAREARRRGILVNVVDDPDAGTFHTVATVRRGDLLLAISTGGASPAVASLLRRKLEREIGSEYAELLDVLGRLRRATMRELPTAVREWVWRELASEETLDWLRAGRYAEVEACAEALVARAEAEAHGDTREEHQV